MPCSSTNDVSGAYSSKALSDTLDKDPILLQQSTVLAIIILRPLASLENSLQSTSLNILIRNEHVTIIFKTANFRFASPYLTNWFLYHYVSLYVLYC